MFSPSVSVIVPVYNEEKSIGSCLNSILSVDYPPELLEIIVSDNGSTDDTPTILESFGEQITVVYESTRGPGAARNKGLKAASGTIVAFTDADCTVDRAWLRSIIAPLEEVEVGIVGGRRLARRPANQIELLCEDLRSHKSMIETRIPTVATENWASRTELIREQGGFDEEFIRAEDSDLSFRIFDEGFRIEYAPDAITHHENIRTYRKLFREGYQQGIASVQFAKKHVDARKRHGIGRVYWSTYRALGKNGLDVIMNRGASRAMGFFTFNLGKKLGRYSGSMRYLHLEL